MGVLHWEGFRARLVGKLAAAHRRVFLTAGRMNSTADGESVKSKMPRFRFNLKLGLTFVSLICVWLAVESSRARKQDRAAQLVRRCGGHITFVERFDKGAFRSINPLSIVPDWLRWPNEHFFKRPAQIEFEPSSNNEKSRVTDDDLELLRYLPTLRELLLSTNQSVTDDALQHLTNLKKLTILTLSHTDVTGYGLRHLSKMHSLEGLDLGHTPLTDEALEHVGKLSSIKWLLLNDTLISDAGVRRLSALDSLSTLVLSDTKITDDSLTILHDFKYLKHLSLLGTSVSGNSVAELQDALPNCRILWRDERRIILSKIRELGGQVELHRGAMPAGARDLNRQKDFAQVMKLQDDMMPAEFPDDIRDELSVVISISIHSQSFTDNDLKMLAFFSELKYLDVAETQVSEDGLKVLGNLRKLEGVDLSINPRVTDSSLTVLQDLPEIKMLSLRNTGVSDNALAQLADVPQLERLYVSSRYITDEGMKHLGSIKNLKQLDLGGNIAGLEFEYLTSLTQLEELSLDNTRITDRSIEGLSKLKQLRVLNVKRTDMSNSGVAALRTSLPTTQVLFLPKPDPNPR